MNEIKLLVDDKNLEIVSTILKNLKEGLLTTIEINGKSDNVRTTQYKPKTNVIIKEEESGTSDTSGKYINPAAYKQRLKTKPSHSPKKKI